MQLKYRVFGPAGLHLPHQIAVDGGFRRCCDQSPPRAGLPSQPQANEPPMLTPGQTMSLRSIIRPANSAFAVGVEVRARIPPHIDAARGVGIDRRHRHGVVTLFTRCVYCAALEPELVAIPLVRQRQALLPQTHRKHHGDRYDPASRRTAS